MSTIWPLTAAKTSNIPKSTYYNILIKDIYKNFKYPKEFQLPVTNLQVFTVKTIPESFISSLEWVFNGLQPAFFTRINHIYEINSTHSLDVKRNIKDINTIHQLDLTKNPLHPETDSTIILFDGSDFQKTKAAMVELDGLQNYPFDINYHYFIYPINDKYLIIIVNSSNVYCILYDSEITNLAQGSLNDSSWKEQLTIIDSSTFEKLLTNIEAYLILIKLAN